MTNVSNGGISPSECPVPSYHLTHRYCPHCSWTEPTDAMDEAMAAAVQLGAALARLDNALDKLRAEKAAT